ncbi:MAG: hypothetical protein JWP39_3987, partial [Jatrophihabitans sp.]|nr:hypothetical protein [Jatrophihabitans sp.]
MPERYVPKHASLSGTAKASTALPSSASPAGGRLRRWSAAGTVVALVGGVISAMTMVAAAPAGAGTTSVSTFSKTGTNLANNSTADSVTGSAGSAQPGDKVKWVMHYANKTGADATVNIADPLGAGQAYVPNSLQTPPNLTPTVTATDVGANGTVPAGTTVAHAPLFAVSTANFSTVGGDGYSVEGAGNNIYTVYHHSTDPTTVFCATIAGDFCAGWPTSSHTSYVSPIAGTPLGTGAASSYTTAGANGSFIANGRLYWPVENTQPANGLYEVGVMCLDLGALTSCGFTHLDDQTSPPVSGTVGQVASDGIVAGDGNYYLFDAAGNMLCFNAGSGACGVTASTGGQAVFAGGYTANMLTAGRYVFVTFINSAGEVYTSCHDTVTASLCSGFPINGGPAASSSFPDFIAPVLSTSGALLGVCDVNKARCNSPTGALLANPYVGFAAFGDPGTGGGFGEGAIVGTKFYAGDPTTQAIDCFDFALWSGTGVVPSCVGYAAPVDAQNYTVRALANLPGCLAANGNAAQIIVFNQQTGGSCSSASTSLTLAISDYYCDGQSGHATAWSTLSLPGLSSSAYSQAAVTLFGADGSPLPGWTNVSFPPGSTSLDISSIPITGNTSTLTAQVNLIAITDLNAVQASTVQLAWQGDEIEVCFQTVMPQVPCLDTVPASNQATAVTTAGVVSDAPGGNPSGSATFDVTQPDSACAIDFAKRASPSPADPGDTVTYTITAHNTGTADYGAGSPASFTDDLTAVLTDSAYQNDVSATSGTALYNSTSHVLSWSGPLAAGATVTVTYTVNIDNPDNNGTHRMSNRVVSPDPSNCQVESSDPNCLAEVPISGYTVAKVAAMSKVHPGDSVTYTITVTNIGQVDYTAGKPATFDDDLSQVIDDASYNNDASATAGTPSYDANTHVLSWSGPLPVNGQVTIQYTVTVQVPDAGDKLLANTVQPTGPGGSCADGSLAPCPTIEVPVQSYSVAKVASAATVHPGDKVTYTVTVTNTGAVAYTASDLASFTDDLTKVLDDAAYNGDANASDGTVGFAPADSTLSWSGPLPVEGMVTVTYSVTVDAPETGDYSLVNAAVPDAPGGACADGALPKPSCSPVEVLVQAYSVAKVASAATVLPGGTVTYTITVTNTGKVDYTEAAPASFADDLTKVLDDATFSGDAQASAGAVNYSAPTLAWAGALP